MTFITCARRLAYNESMALRAFARQGRMPTHRPVDYWTEWQRIDKHTNATTKRKTAA